ncbi:pyocin knob domain-containing protein [Aliarcobacter butzleri]|uniref:pyocin knob domain-containing protein n=1 Tax=Aliarcobacter butzleri TaxID=28197 RepID=UPI001EDC8B37|nr:pyocin knob domain-containing protein [Aliarcobacter butzleri]MCG3656007.1 pyocin knob domain-containing protein [Aliarcobacter butzleri]
MSSKIIPVGFDNITILRGSKYVGVWDWEDCDFEGRTATIKIKNIHPDFKDKKNAWEVGTARVEPLDIDGNPYKGRVKIELTKEETFLLSIPEEEEFLYDEEGGYYSVLNIILDDGTVILSANVKVINSLEVETLDYLVDEKDKAAIINEKLDDILLRNDEYIFARDNLIDVVIPEALNTYNLNHAEKIQILEDIATIVGQDKNIVVQDKLDIETMKQNVQDNKDSVTSMKDAIEIMLDTFDDRFLGRKDSDPLTDNDGEPLSIAAIYYNEIDKELKFYNGASWDSPVAAAQTYAQQASQSADSANASKLEAKQSEDNAKLSEETAIQKALEAKQSADSASEDRIVVEELESSVQNLALQVTNDKQAVSLDKQTILNAKTDIEDIRDNLQSSVDSISSKVNISDVQDLLNSTATDKPLSANQGRVLKGFIDNINTVLNSDDTTLDELQEIVNYIKQNKSTLDSLGISNIAGLVDALSNKVDKVNGKGLSSNDFTTTEKNKLANIENGAQANVTPTWNSVTEKPEFNENGFSFFKGFKSTNILIQGTNDANLFRGNKAEFTNVGTPTTATYLVFTFSYNNTEGTLRIIQIAYGYSVNTLYMRTMNNSTTTAWVEK